MNRSDKESFLFCYGSIYDPDDLKSNIFNNISEKSITHIFISLAKGGEKHNTKKEASQCINSDLLLVPQGILCMKTKGVKMDFQCCLDQ